MATEFNNATLGRDKSFLQIRPSGPLRRSSLESEVGVELKLSPDPSEADFVRKLSTLQREKKTLTRTLRKREEKERLEARKLFSASLLNPSRQSSEDLPKGKESSGELLTPDGSKDLKKKKSAAAPTAAAAAAATTTTAAAATATATAAVNGNRLPEKSPSELERGESGRLHPEESRRKKRQSHVEGEPGAILNRASTFSEDPDDDLEERIHRRRSKSNPHHLPNHSVKFELNEMDKNNTLEYVSFDELRRRQSVPGIPVHPHNYKQWLQKRQSELRLPADDDHTEDEEELDPSQALQSLKSLNNLRPTQESESDSDQEIPLKERHSKENTGSDFSIATQGETNRALLSGSSQTSSPPPTTITESPRRIMGEPSFVKEKSKRRRKRQPFTLKEDLYPWEHFGLQQAIMAANLVSLLSAFAILFGVSAWSVSLLGQQTSSFLGNSTLQFVSVNLTGQFQFAEEVLSSMERTVLLNSWSYDDDHLLLQHYLAILLDPTATQTTGALFYAEPGNKYLQVENPLGTEEIQIGTTSGSFLILSNLNTDCALTNSSCSLVGSQLTTIPYSTATTHWNNTLQAHPFTTDLVLSPFHTFPSKAVGTVLVKEHETLGQQDFVLGLTLEPLRLSAALLDLRKFLQGGSAETDLVIYIVDSSGYLVAISLENPVNYLFQPQPCQDPCRATAAQSQVPGIGDIYTAFQEVDDLDAQEVEVVVGAYRGLKRRVAFGKRTFEVVVSIREGAFVSSYQTIQYIVIAVTFFGILVIILFAIRLVTQRLTRSVDKVSKMMVDMANLQLTYTPMHEARRFHIKETERLVSAMEIMNVALRSFIKYVPQEVVRILVQESAEVIIGVDDSFLTIFFSDIEGFTTISEILEPSDLIQVMSEYLEEMSQIILDSSGVVDKYIGDAIMAFWNAPLSVPAHRAVACAVALRMQRRLRKLNSEWEVRGIPTIRTRIGINAGIALVGNLGSPQRMSYTCIGDCVNTASRLESLNKYYGTYIMISENVHQSGTVQENFLCRSLDFVCVKGKSQPIQVYELVCELKLATDEIKTQLKCFNEAFDLYRKRDFATAARLFSRYLRANADDKAAEILRQRCKQYIKTPPPVDWDGSFMATEK